LTVLADLLLPREETPIPEWLQNAAAHLAHHPEERISIEALAQEAALSASQFRRRFQAAFGSSPARYAIEKRIETAQALMVYEGLSVKEAAARLGYPDAFAFSRQFKEVTGQSPSQAIRQTPS
jgi:AraC-like DNA-binding protein